MIFQSNYSIYKLITKLLKTSSKQPETKLPD